MSSQQRNVVEREVIVGAEVVEVAELAARPDRADQFVDRALDVLTDEIPFDLAAFLQLQGDGCRVQQVRGELAAEALHGHRVELARHPTLRRVLEERLPILMRLAGSEESAIFEDLLALPEDHSTLLVPVVVGADDVGVMVFVSRDHDIYGDETIHLALAYGQLIGLGLAAARQARLLEGYRDRLEEQNRLLIEDAAADTDACRAMEQSVNRAMRRLTQMARQVAITDSPVLITGETGTGKEVLARAIHAWSGRADEPFIQVNCAALPESLVESELFGHLRGAFSGAVSDRPGRFRVADGGTLLLDEIGDLPAATQVRLLRVLQEGTLEPVGSDESVQVDVRVIAATNADLERAIDEGRFREDLYYRLNVFPMHLPPLRERIEDLPVLTRHIIERTERRTGRGPWTVGPVSMRRMQSYHWPGNVRELVNVIERARVFCPLGGELRIDLPRSRGKRRSTAGEEGGWLPLKEHEKRYIEKVLVHTGGKIYGPDGAAVILGLPPTTLQSRIARLGVERPGS